MHKNLKSNRYLASQFDFQHCFSTYKRNQTVDPFSLVNQQYYLVKVLDLGADLYFSGGCFSYWHQQSTAWTLLVMDSGAKGIHV